MEACNRTVSVGIMIESRAGLAAAADIASLDGVDYLNFGMLDLAQSLGHPGDAAHPDVRAAVDTCIEAIHRAGKRVREDFMNFAWINDVLMTGVRRLLDEGSRVQAPQPYGMAAQAGGMAND
jgi:2-keto-3-deoxy-L-rhamnonate aldolase RhmA